MFPQGKFPSGVMGGHETSIHLQRVQQVTYLTQVVEQDLALVVQHVWSQHNKVGYA
jgi:hypothetical protein